ncbi:unnamed protein product [Polarella glacialis]|uniref:Uncharacterized protein n=1 Tax=Polarella glacialis TaxID=89957 RepID=A0A813KQ77_POLGL|nr:unnamed protein product [Polarella glacialis]
MHEHIEHLHDCAAHDHPSKLLYNCSGESYFVQKHKTLHGDIHKPNFRVPIKGEPVLPINIVAFDPSTVGNDEEKASFVYAALPSGSFMIDTSNEDLVALDKMLKAVQVKRKQLDKLNKKLDKMEDLSERVTEDRSLLQMQIALMRMLENDLELSDWALKNEEQLPEPEI